MTLPLPLDEEWVTRGVSLPQGHESHTCTLWMEWEWEGLLSYQTEKLKY